MEKGNGVSQGQVSWGGPISDLRTPCQVDNKPTEPSKPGSIKTTDELLMFHVRTCLEARETMRLKNNDYGDQGDPFANFREFGRYGIAVRMSDKWQRFVNLVKAEQGLHSEMQVNEDPKDTLHDFINYAILWLAYPEEK